MVSECDRDKDNYPDRFVLGHTFHLFLLQVATWDVVRGRVNVDRWVKVSLTLKMVGAVTETNCHGNTASSLRQMWPVAMDGIRETFIAFSIHIDALCFRSFNSKRSYSAFVIGAQNFFLLISYMHENYLVRTFLLTSSLQLINIWQLSNLLYKHMCGSYVNCSIPLNSTITAIHTEKQACNNLLNLWTTKLPLNYSSSMKCSDYMCEGI